MINHTSGTSPSTSDRPAVFAAAIEAYARSYREEQKQRLAPVCRESVPRGFLSLKGARRASAAVIERIHHLFEHMHTAVGAASVWPFVLQRPSSELRRGGQ